MNIKSQKHWSPIGIVLILLFVGLGCSLTDLLAFEPAAASAIVPTTATTASPVAMPISDETQAANALETQVIAVYEAVSPAVVNITNRGYAYDMFMRAVPQEGSGSGFVYDAEGHIVTNYHVVENAEELLVTLASGQVYKAEIIGTDPTNDLAVIALMPVPICRSW